MVWIFMFFTNYILISLLDAIFVFLNINTMVSAAGVKFVKGPGFKKYTAILPNGNYNHMHM